MSYVINQKTGRKIKVGGPTYLKGGWAIASPKKGKERNQLMDKCGKVCFLRPEVKKYPICAALREGKGCKIDCRGVLAAKKRANQHKDLDVIRKVSKLCL
jgi:hypothetical protein